MAVMERVATPLTVWPLRRGGLTVRVLAAQEPLWHGGDIAAALNMLDATSAGFVHLPGWDLVPFLNTDQVRTVVGDDQLLEQIEWIAGCLAASHTPRPGVPLHSRRDVVPEPIVDMTADTWSVGAAASILSRDPVITVGREALFDLLRELGWVDRRSGIFTPSPESIDDGFLIVNTVWARRAHVAYNRIRITRAGVTVLHARLGGVTTPTFDVPEQPALLEIP